MPRTKKEEAHKPETCVCSDCKTRKLELEVIDLRARYADERAHYQALLDNVKTALEQSISRMEARVNLDWRTSLADVSKRVALLEAGVAETNQKGYSDIVRRLRTLEANRPVDIRDSDTAAIQRDLKVVTAKLGRIVDRLDPPNGLPF